MEYKTMRRKKMIKPYAKPEKKRRDWRD